MPVIVVINAHQTRSFTAFSMMSLFSALLLSAISLYNTPHPRVASVGTQRALKQPQRESRPDRCPFRCEESSPRLCCRHIRTQLQSRHRRQRGCLLDTFRAQRRPPSNRSGPRSAPTPTPCKTDACFVRPRCHRPGIVPPSSSRHGVSTKEGHWQSGLAQVPTRQRKESVDFAGPWKMVCLIGRVQECWVTDLFLGHKTRFFCNSLAHGCETVIVVMYSWCRRGSPLHIFFGVAMRFLSQKRISKERAQDYETCGHDSDAGFEDRPDCDILGHGYNESAQF
jgi:hypothetical protein